MKKTAGLLLYRKTGEAWEVFLVHPGGPFWKNKDEGAWSIPKGEFEDPEDPLVAAVREFEEETGFAINGHFRPLSPVKQKSGKLVMVWAVEGDLDANSIRSNMFELEWPPRSGRLISVEEIDKGGWFSVTEARKKIIPGQLPFLAEFEKDFDFS